MTKISSYSTDVNITGNDKWIGSDAQNFLITKNFTPNNLAGFFNDNNVIDIGLSIRYRYQTLDPGEEREQGTISFETEIGPQVNFSSITTFLLAKNTLKQNNVTQYLGFLVGAKVVISRSNNVNTFGYYTISSIEPYIPDTNFFVVTLEFISGNGFIYEDLDYLISLVDKSSGGGSTEWGNIGGDIENQTDLVNYISTSLSGYVPYIGATEALNIGEYSFNAQSALGDYISLDGTQLYLFNASLGSTMIIDGSQIFVFDSVGTSSLSTSSLGLNGATISYSALFSGDNFLLPNKLGAGGTFAMLSDIPSYIIPTLQEVLTEGNTAADLNIKLEDSIYNTYTEFTGFDTRIKEIGTNNNIFNYGGYGNFVVWDGVNPDYIQQLSFDPLGAEAQNFLIPSKPTGNYTLATLDDIPSLSGYVPYTGATSDVNLGEFGLLTGNIEFDNTPTTIPTGAGSAYWNDSDGTLNLILKGGNVTLQIGQEQVLRVVNKTATNINLLEANYQAVRVTGAQGQRLKVDLAQATSDLLSAETIGLVTETIDNNQEGFITTSGLVRNINTTGSIQGETWADGDVLYLSPTVAGNVTKVKPVAPNHLVIIGYVIHSHITQGSIFVKVDNGYELNELHNVLIDTPLENQTLAYDSVSEVWENRTMVEDAISDGVTDKAPSQNAVFDSLALKENLSNKSDNTSLGSSTSLYPTQNAVKTYVDAAVGAATGTASARASRFELSADMNLPISVTGSVSVLDFDSSIFNVDTSLFTNNGSGVVTCTQAGNYLITTCVVIESPLASAITKTELGIRKNGTDIVCATTDDTPIALGNNTRSLTTSTIINLNANDTLASIVNLFGAAATGRALRLPSLFGTTVTQVSNISIEKLETSGVGASIIQTITDGVTDKVPSSNAVFDALALKQNLLGYTPYKFIQTSQTATTGTTAETLVATATINGATFNTSDVMKVLFGVNKTGTGGVYSIRLRINTTNTLVGATQVALFTAVGTSNQTTLMSRNFPLNGGILYGFSFTGSLVNDASNNGGVISSTAYNTANTLYFFWTVQLANAGDSIIPNLTYLTN